MLNDAMRKIEKDCFELCFSNRHLVDYSAWTFDRCSGSLCNREGSSYPLLFGIKEREKAPVPCTLNPERSKFMWFDIDDEAFPYTLYYGVELPKDASPCPFSIAKGMFISVAMLSGYFKNAPEALLQWYNPDLDVNVQVAEVISNNTIRRYALENNILKFFDDGTLCTVNFGKSNPIDVMKYVKSACATLLEVNDVYIDECKSIRDTGDVNLMECVVCGQPFHYTGGSLICPDCLN